MEIADKGGSTRCRAAGNTVPKRRIGVLRMSKPNFLSTVRFLSLATAALVTGPAATYAAMDPPEPKLDCAAANNAGKGAVPAE
jgi:hypothetical protein